MTCACGGRSSRPLVLPRRQVPPSVCVGAPFAVLPCTQLLPIEMILPVPLTTSPVAFCVTAEYATRMDEPSSARIPATELFERLLFWIENCSMPASPPFQAPQQFPESSEASMLTEGVVPASEFVARPAREFPTTAPWTLATEAFWVEIPSAGER